KNGIFRAQLYRALKMLDRFLIVAEPIMGPAQAVDDVAVVTFLAHGLLNQRLPLLQITALIDPGVAEIVEGQRLVWAQLQCALQVGFGERPLLDAFIAGAARVEERPMLLFWLVDERDGSGIVLDRLLVTLLA